MRLASSNLNKVALCLLTLIFVLSCKKEENKDLLEAPLTKFTITYPKYFPKMVVPENNPTTAEGIALGRKLYYDPILSRTGYSCSSCHNQSESFSFNVVNSLPHINLAWNENFLWNGKIKGTMEDIMMFEVEEFFNTDVAKLNESSEYKKEFAKVYKVTHITSKEIAFALAQFFRTMNSYNAKYDKFVNRETDLSASEMRGFQIFNTEKGDCFHCHSVGLFTDNQFHNIGLDTAFTGTNRGKFEISGDASDMGLFKTPTLRNIEFTGPYMHDGRFTTLEEVVDFYNSKVKFNATIDPLMTKGNKLSGLKLSAQDKSDLIAFLKSLSDKVYLSDQNFQKP